MIALLWFLSPYLGHYCLNLADYLTWLLLCHLLVVVIDEPSWWTLWLQCSIWPWNLTLYTALYVEFNIHITIFDHRMWFSPSTYALELDNLVTCLYRGHLTGLSCGFLWLRNWLWFRSIIWAFLENESSNFFLRCLFVWVVDPQYIACLHYLRVHNWYCLLTLVRASVVGFWIWFIWFMHAFGCSSSLTSLVCRTKYIY